MVKLGKKRIMHASSFYHCRDLLSVYHFIQLRTKPNDHTRICNFANAAGKGKRTHNPSRWLVVRNKSPWDNFCVKAPKIDDRKWVCIDLILTHLRSSILRSFHARNYFKNFCQAVLVVRNKSSWDNFCVKAPKIDDRKVGCIASY